MFKGLKRITVNWHLEKDCNYKCKFCYAHFSHINTNLNIDQGFALIDEIKNNTVFKLTLGGCIIQKLSQTVIISKEH